MYVMFNMKIERQLNLKDRTLLLGVPNCDIIPKVVVINKSEYKVLGISSGIKPPSLSLEIERTDLSFTKQIIVGY